MGDADSSGLPRALARWRADGGLEAEARVWAALAVAHLLVPVTASVGSPAAPDGRDTSDLSLVSLADADGGRSLVAFSDVTAMTAWRPDVRPVGVAARDVARAVLAEGFGRLVVDPGTGQFVVSPAQVTVLAEGYVPVAGEGAQLASRQVDRPLALGGVDALPDGLAPAVRAALSHEAAVAEGFLLEARLPDEPVLLLLGLVLFEPIEPAGLAGLVQRLADRVGPHLPSGGNGLDVTVLDDKKREQALAVAVPAYVAESADPSTPAR